MNRYIKPLHWISSSLRDLKRFPKPVLQDFGFALDQAQRGGKHPDAKPLKGFSGSSVQEIVSDFDGNTYRCVYILKFLGAVYCLHAFQKKSKMGISTSKIDIELIQARIKVAEQHYKANYDKKQKN